MESAPNVKKHIDAITKAGGRPSFKKSKLDKRKRVQTSATAFLLYRGGDLGPGAVFQGPFGNVVRNGFAQFLGIVAGDLLGFYRIGDLFNVLLDFGGVFFGSITLTL